MIRLAVAIACLGVSAGAHAACSADVAHRAATAQYLLGTLHPDKPGQMRVRAINGSEFSAGQVRWMTGQMHHAATACERSDEQAAAFALADVESILGAHPPV